MTPCALSAVTLSSASSRRSRSPVPRGPQWLEDLKNAPPRPSKCKGKSKGKKGKAKGIIPRRQTVENYATHGTIQTPVAASIAVGCMPVRLMHARSLKMQQGAVSANLPKSRDVGSLCPPTQRLQLPLLRGHLCTIRISLMSCACSAPVRGLRLLQIYRIQAGRSRALMFLKELILTCPFCMFKNAFCKTYVRACAA